MLQPGDGHGGEWWTPRDLPSLSCPLQRPDPSGTGVVVFVPGQPPTLTSGTTMGRPGPATSRTVGFDLGSEVTPIRPYSEPPRDSKYAFLPPPARISLYPPEPTTKGWWTDPAGSDRTRPTQPSQRRGRSPTGSDYGERWYVQNLVTRDGRCPAEEVEPGAAETQLLGGITEDPDPLFIRRRTGRPERRRLFLPGPSGSSFTGLLMGWWTDPLSDFRATHHGSRWTQYSEVPGCQWGHRFAEPAEPRPSSSGSSSTTRGRSEPIAPSPWPGFVLLGLVRRSMVGANLPPGRTGRILPLFVAGVESGRCCRTRSLRSPSARRTRPVSSTAESSLSIFGRGVVALKGSSTSGPLVAVVVLWTPFSSGFSPRGWRGHSALGEVDRGEVGTFDETGEGSRARDSTVASISRRAGRGGRARASRRRRGRGSGRACGGPSSGSSRGGRGRSGRWRRSRRSGPRRRASGVGAARDGAGARGVAGQLGAGFDQAGSRASPKGSGRLLSPKTFHHRASQPPGTSTSAARTRPTPGSTQWNGGRRRYQVERRRGEVDVLEGGDGHVKRAPSCFERRRSASRSSSSTAVTVARPTPAGGRWPDRSPGPPPGHGRRGRGRSAAPAGRRPAPGTAGGRCRSHRPRRRRDPADRSRRQGRPSSPVSRTRRTGVPFPLYRRKKNAGSGRGIRLSGSRGPVGLDESPRLEVLVVLEPDTALEARLRPRARRP